MQIDCFRRTLKTCLFDQYSAHWASALEALFATMRHINWHLHLHLMVANVGRCLSYLKNWARQTHSYYHTEVAITDSVATFRSSSRYAPSAVIPRAETIAPFSGIHTWRSAFHHSEDVLAIHTHVSIFKLSVFSLSLVTFIYLKYAVAKIWQHGSYISPSKFSDFS